MNFFERFISQQLRFAEIRWLADKNAREIANLLPCGRNIEQRADEQRDSLYAFTKPLADENAELFIDLYDEEFLSALVRHSCKKGCFESDAAS